MNRNLTRCVPPSRQPQDQEATTWDQRVPESSGLQTVQSLWHGPIVVPHQDPATSTWQPLSRSQAASGRSNSWRPLNQRPLYGLGIRVDLSSGGASSGGVYTRPQQGGSSSYQFAHTRGGWWRKAKSKTPATSVEVKTQGQAAHRMNDSAMFDCPTSYEPIVLHHPPASLGLPTEKLDLPPHILQHPRQGTSVSFRPNQSNNTSYSSVWDQSRTTENPQNCKGQQLLGAVQNSNATIS